MRYCTTVPACKTCNYNPTTATCELKNATADGEFSRDLRSRPGFDHYQEIDVLDYALHDEM